MLTKLLKYDLKSLYKIALPTYIIALLTGILYRIFYFLSNKINILNIPYGLITILFFTIVICLPLVTFIAASIRFYQNIIKDEGYLMNTLPVKKSILILSKVLSSIIVNINSVIASTIACLVGVLASSLSLTDLKQILLLLYVDKTSIILFIILAFTSFIMNQLMIYLSIALGQLHNKNKLAFMFIYLIIIYYGTQIISTFVLILPLVINKGWQKYLEQTIPTMPVFNTVLIMTIIFSAVISIIYYLITKNLLDKKLNLE